ncbi:Uncharacterized membrane protein [Oceanobacillus limi]|uniref:Uncharacterized membrane protein n=1 Tax=Oceanobacillus limi TaxID=930131 RepID=A0A1I0GLR8_9BACI|nr:DUF5808 domain-containing protein [Oceanobacillus limi]SET71024.1 Uncharacterized membrane protein [Oceanobacillus limi]
MSQTVILMIGLILIPVFLSTMFIPYWTRKTESFGVSIPEEFYGSSILKKLRKKYVYRTGILSVITGGAYVYGSSLLEGNEQAISTLIAIVTGMYIIISFLVYLVFHQKMKQLKKEQEGTWTKKSQLVVIHTNFRQQKLTYSNFWFSISFFIAIITLFIALQNYQQIPERIPMQYDFSGEVTNWATKSYRSILIMPLMQVYLTLLFLLVNVIIAKAKQQVNAENPEESMQKNVIFRRRWSAFIIITGIGLSLLFLFIQLTFIYSIPTQLITIIPLLYSFGVIIGTIWLAITTGQGGSRVTAKSKTGDGTIIDRDDDQYWKLGIFYFNKNDPAIFLEKRFGVGWTNNWAHPLSWIIIIGIILLAIGIPYLLGA